MHTLVASLVDPANFDGGDACSYRYDGLYRVLEVSDFIKHQDDWFSLPIQYKLITGKSGHRMCHFKLQVRKVLNVLAITDIDCDQRLPNQRPLEELPMRLG